MPTKQERNKAFRQARRQKKREMRGNIMRALKEESDGEVKAMLFRLLDRVNRGTLYLHEQEQMFNQIMTYKGRQVG